MFGFFRHTTKIDKILERSYEVERFSDFLNSLTSDELLAVGIKFSSVSDGAYREFPKEKGGENFLGRPYRKHQIHI